MDKQEIKIGNITIPLNIMGQIDLLHSGIWASLTIVVIFITQFIKWLAR